MIKFLVYNIKERHHVLRRTIGTRTEENESSSPQQNLDPLSSSVFIHGNDLLFHIQQQGKLYCTVIDLLQIVIYLKRYIHGLEL